MIIGNVAYSLAAGGGFCAGSQVVVDHQRINGSAFVFSASMPGMLATSASEGINILRNTPSLLSTLQENVRAIRAVLDRVDCITVPSHPASPLIHFYIRPLSSNSLTPQAAADAPRPGARSNPTSVLPHTPETFDIPAEERLLQEIVDDCLANGVLVTRAKRLRGQEMVEARASIRLAVTSALSRKECEKAAAVIKAAAMKVLGRRR
jgi:serine palmitoyltransferase